MDREWLSAKLAAGVSIEAIAREVGRDPSTVAHWVRKHDLASQHATRHASRGPIERAALAALVDEGLTIQQIAKRLGRRPTSVRHWLRKHGLRTARARHVGTDPDAGDVPVVARTCRKHGMTSFVRTRSGRYRCKRCRVEAVSERRRKVKRTLIEEAGGVCSLCGYDRYVGALHFHHLDPEAKAFALASQGVARALDKARAEARKCVLLCANCHAEVEGGVATIRAAGA